MAPPGRRNALPRCRSLCCNDGGMPLAASRSAASRIRGRPSATAAASVSSSRRGSASGQRARRVRQRRHPADDRVRLLREGGHAGREHRLGVVGEHLLHGGEPLHHVDPVRHRRHVLVVPHRQAEVGGRQPPAVAVDGERRGHGIRDERVDDLHQGRLERLRGRVLLHPHPTGVGLDPRHDRPEPHPLTDDRRGGAHPGGVEGRHQPGRQVGQPLLALPEGREVALRHGAPRPTRSPRRSPAPRAR